MSRWGLDANLAPGFLIFGLHFFLKGLEERKFLLLSGLFYGLSLPEEGKGGAQVSPHFSRAEGNFVPSVAAHSGNGQKGKGYLRQNLIVYQKEQKQRPTEGGRRWNFSTGSCPLPESSGPGQPGSPWQPPIWSVLYCFVIVDSGVDADAPGLKAGRGRGHVVDHGGQVLGGQGLCVEEQPAAVRGRPELPSGDCKAPPDQLPLHSPGAGTGLRSVDGAGISPQEAHGYVSDLVFFTLFPGEIHAFFQALGKVGADSLPVMGVVILLKQYKTDQAPEHRNSLRHPSSLGPLL